MTKRFEKTRKLTILAILTALMAVLTFTPIGFLQIPPMVSITFMHVPVIIGAVLLGPTAGGILGFLFGLMSMLKATFMGTGIGDFIFSPFMSGQPIGSIIMCFLPRILMGVIAGWLYLLLQRKLKFEVLSIGIAAGVTSLFHSVSVLGLMWLLFGQLGSLRAVFAAAFGINGLLEMVVAVILSTAICKALFVVMKRTRK